MRTIGLHPNLDWSQSLLGTDLRKAIVISRRNSRWVNLLFFYELRKIKAKKQPQLYLMHQKYIPPLFLITKSGMMVASILSSRSTSPFPTLYLRIRQGCCMSTFFLTLHELTALGDECNNSKIQSLQKCHCSGIKRPILQFDDQNNLFLTYFLSHS